MTKTTRERFKIAVIEAIHGLPYEEAIEEEAEAMYNDGQIFSKPYPITIGRVMQALRPNYKNSIVIAANGDLMDMSDFPDVEIFANWTLIKENGQECEDSDQTDETITSLLALLTKSDENSNT